MLVSSLYGVYQRIQGVEVNESYVDLEVNAGMPGRVESYFDNPNTFAEVLILLLPLVLALILCSKRGISRVTACGVFAVGVLALGMTYSRASWVGMACAMVVLVFLWKPKLIPAFAVLCVVMVPFLPDTIWHRVLTIFNPADTSTASRIPLYQAALEVIRTSPVSGAGLGTAAVQDYISDFNLYHAEAPFVHAHNFYLQVWIEADCWGSWALWAPCCGTSKRRPARSGTAPPLPPAPSPVPERRLCAAPWCAVWRITCGTIPG
ncbi:MAG: O-antigen ligase family protein [Dysosmobacter welbionis]